MKISFNFLVRIAGMLVLVSLAEEIGRKLSGGVVDDTEQLAIQLLMLAGPGLGLLVTPRITIAPMRTLLAHLRQVPLGEIVLMSLGGAAGLVAGVLLAYPLSLLPMPLGAYLPVGIAAMLAYIGITVLMIHRQSLQEVLQTAQEFVRAWRRLTSVAIALAAGSAGATNTGGRRYLLDTSVIIDGRIASIGTTGFLDGTLLVPQFVLLELQSLADSNDDLRRSKGRRGLELLNQMQKDTTLPVEVIDVDVGGVTRVDDKLVMLARQYNCPIITNDFNLNRVAGLQGVRVLSLNQLSDAVRPPVTQDQHLQVLIRNEGNARQQGVGYLDDGTPVIVEDARHLIGSQVEVVVTRLHQTQTGRLVFAHLASNGATGGESRHGRKA